MARSLRSQVAVAVLLWTVGIIAATQLMALALIHHLHFGPPTVHWILLTMVAAMFMAVGIVSLRRGVSPIAALRARLADVRGGRTARVEGSYPTEVQPLVDDLNALLDHQDQAVRRAVTKAGDLAHGLKTPLAVLAHEAERARTEGQAELAAAIDQQVDRMRRQVDVHLAQARAAASGATPGAHSGVSVSVDGLVRTMARLYAERRLAIDSNVEASHLVRAQREDLDEMLGNLLDNACKWAKSRILVASAATDARVVITVDDDGPGLDPSMREAVLQRGVRADEAAPGTGFGLAIVRDLAELYGGSIVLEHSPIGGLRTRLDLPRA